jgi:rSAM/selenodomain-associated transferase 1
VTAGSTADLADAPNVTRASVAVAVMAKAPGFVPVKSRLQPPLTADEARALASAFLLDRLDGVAALAGAVAVLAYTPAEAEAALRTLTPAGVGLLAQRGDGLGDRLTCLFADLLTGHAGALALDADSPTLPMAWVADGIATLAADDADVVLGPTEDGGYWSIGLRAPCPALFAGVPWSTDRVLSTTLTRAEALGLRVRLLPRWFDVDTEPDLRRLCDEVAASGGPRRTAALASALSARLAAGAAR